MDSRLRGNDVTFRGAALKLASPFVLGPHTAKVLVLPPLLWPVTTF
jgi:hypothetical protein